MTPTSPSSRTVLVTGASSGIGQATARLFAESGFRVFGTSRQQRPDQHGVRMLTMDVRSASSVQHCVDQVLSDADCIDVLINNAGVMHEGFAEETTIAEAEAILDTNLLGAARVINAVLPGMRAHRHGRIITVGSLAAWVGEPGEAFYAASKAGLARYTEALRHEVWPLGVAVSLIEPGAFTTNVLDAASASAGTIADYDQARQAARATLHNSLRNGADPRAVATRILAIANTRTPRYRYGAGRDGRWLPYLKLLVPQRLFDYLLRRSFGLHDRQTTR
ncbi:SDR family NAD(P)-dependent oxidoreductase [Micromonospora sp. MS34]|uniref:SDR family NAD(P)-dependent oxidoreductase n=1 Tax=Micromonospora sp. MS34 TaxID=3385971 RepID=UPI0039A3DEA9